MDRERSLQRIAGSSTRFDVLVIGGGATGLGAAVEAASRGYLSLGFLRCGADDAIAPMQHRAAFQRRIGCGWCRFGLRQPLA